MADQVNKEALNEYNDLLRDSINLSRQLSDNVLMLAGRSAKLTLEARTTRELTRDIESETRKTIGLTDKLLAGKLKVNDAVTQLNTLQQKYTKYVNDSKDETTELGSFLKKIGERTDKNNTEQINYTNRLNKLNQEIVDADKKRDNLNKQLRKTSIETNKENYNAIQQQIKDVTKDIQLKEKSVDLTLKLLTKSQEEGDALERVVEANNKIVENYEEQISNNETILEQLKKQSLFTKLANSQIRNYSYALRDVMNLLGPLVAVFEFFKKIAFDASKQVVQLQKGLMVSADEAYRLRDGFADAALDSNNVLITTNALIASNVALGKQLGFNARFSNDAVVEFTKLTKQIGLSEEAAGGLAKFAKANGMTLKETKTVALGVSQQLSSQYGIQLDQREVLEEIGKISGQTLAMFKANPAALAQAVAQAKLLGTNLDIAKKQASSLLDFESSIENELQAELITGQQLNLERARSAALVGDLTTTMKELNNQNIDFNRFSNMNVIAQEKVAAALGLSTDELSDQLLKQQYMNMSREQVVALAGEEVAQRLEAVSAQDKFNAAMEKMQDIVGRLVGGPLGQLADMMAKLLDNTYVLYGVLGAISAISLIKLLAGLSGAAVKLSIMAAGAITASSALTFGLSVIAIGAAIGGLMALLTSSTDKAASNATKIGDMFSSNGKTLISTAEGGLFEPSPNDDIAVAPGIGDMINRQQTSATVIQQDNSALLNAVNILITEAKNTNSGLAQLNAKKSEIKVDSQNFGTTQLIGTYTLA